MNYWRGKPLSDRFWVKVNVGAPDECWRWLAYINRHGYGRFRHKGAQTNAQRVAYELKVGPVPQGMHVLHRCDNPACCNPAHLFLGTNSDNAADRHSKGRDAAMEGNGRAKLTAAKAREIRSSNLSIREAAMAFGVGKSTVHHIRKMHTWRAA